MDLKLTDEIILATTNAADIVPYVTGYVYSVAKGDADLAQEGFLAALVWFERSKSQPAPAAYLISCIGLHVRLYAMKSRRLIFIPFTSFKRNNYSPVQVVSGHEELIPDNITPVDEEWDHLLQMFCVTKLERDVVTLRIGFELTWKAIGEKMNLSTEFVRGVFRDVVERNRRLGV